MRVAKSELPECPFAIPFVPTLIEASYLMEILKRRRGEGRRGEATDSAISAEEIADLHSTRRVMGFSVDRAR